MPQTLCSSTMFTPSGFSPHLVPGEESPQDGPGPGPGIPEGPQLTSASLDTLIQHLVPTADYYPEKAYVFTFLLSSRLFIPPHELLSRVCQLCIKQQQLDQIPLDTAKVRKFGPKILQLLTEWTETFPSDFQDEEMVGHLKDIIRRIAPCDENQQKKRNRCVHTLQCVFLQRGDSAGEFSENVTVISPLFRCVSCSSFFQERLSHIGPEEFVQAFAQKDPLDTTQPCFSDQKKTGNLEAYVKWFNRLCYLVATEICMPAKKKQRAQVIEFFIDVARECFNIGNFNSLMAIISGMNMSPVSRLKKTWGKVKTAKFFILEHQMDPTGNFYNYRTALRGAAHRSQTAHSNREKIVIPFFSLLIKDIYFLNEGCANRLPNGHVNFEKFVELARQVGEFMTWKQVECPFEEERSILHYLHTAPIFNEDGLYLASYESESPENQIEKDRWKTLRSTILGKT
uniref:RasGEF domain family member 1C n=1 Tax=Scleropages formosus TaxID=113540 RepID=A0A8C9VTI9_SCLFO